MTVDEVRSLRQEMEQAILEACIEFKQATGLAVTGIDVKCDIHRQIGRPSSCTVLGISISLETI